jgi:ribonucleoside-diphosphate reductase alpha chain
MMAAAQPFLSGAISKTVNMPEASTVEDIEDAYLEGWKLGLKALAIYRDGSKSSQPLNTSKEGDRKRKTDPDAASVRVGGPRRRHLPATRHSLTHKFNVGGHEGYITVGLFEDAAPGELFITMAKEGSTIGGLMDTIGTLTSLALQYGVPLEALVNKFTHMRFEPSGWTGNPDIPMAKSITDYIFRWLGIQFLPGYREANTPKREPEAGHGTGDDSAEAEPTATARGSAVAEEHPKTAAAIVRSLTDLANGQKHGNGHHKSQIRNPKSEILGSPHIRSLQFATFQADAPACDNCGAITVRNGNCYLCHNCGNSMGCS